MLKTNVLRLAILWVLLVVCGMQNPVLAQSDNHVDVVTADSTVYNEVAEPPQFPGGPNALRGWLKRNTHYPIKAVEDGIEGVVIVSFIVERDGSLSDAKILRNIAFYSSSFKFEAMRAIKAMPKWIPGKNEAGEAVRCRFALQIPFNFQ